MRSARSHAVTLVALLLVVCPTLAWGQEELVVQSWRAQLGDADVTGVSYDGELLIRRAGLRGYLPLWRGGRFDMGGAERAVADASATWHKAQADNQEATLRLDLAEQTCRYSLDTTIRAEGPTEYWAEIVPEALQASDRHMLVWVNGQPRGLLLSETFETIRGIDELRFEQAERTVIVRCSRFELQDRRERGSGLFLVKVISSSGQEPKRAEDFIEVVVQEAAAEVVAGREAMVAQLPVEYQALPLRNADMESEAGLEGWSRNPRAAVDTEVRHAGAQAARLTIEGPLQEAERGQVYLTQSVPVEEGKIYQAEGWIRGENVQRAAVTSMSSVGATLIVEFADKEGKWLASGSYGDNLFGSFDWRRVLSGPARAPKGAGYAIVYLALRATGTAWFDDLGLSEVRNNVLMLEPLPGQAVADNTPRLNWYFTVKTEVTLELSQDEAFPADRIVALANPNLPPVSLQGPIAPGKWFWRVRVPEYGVVSPAWEFLQTASLEEDCTEPVIAGTHGWLAGKTDPVRVRYSDNVGVVKVQLTVDGEDVSQGVRMGRTQATYAPAVGWSDGLHKVVARVEDAAGNWAERRLFFTHSERLPAATWQQIGGVETDGERRYLLGMYGVAIEHMPEMARAGFDFVHSYQWDGAGSNEEAIKYLDEAHKHGLQAFIGIDRQRLMAGDEEFVAERVGALMRHPGLFAWYLYDEPDLVHQYVSPTWLERYYRLIKSLDPFHPVVVTCAGDNAVPQYRDALDVHWTQVYGNTALVARRMDLHRASLHEGTPLAAILHCYDRAQSGLSGEGAGPDPAKFQPDGRQMRANAFMALAHNSSCITWWWWGYGGSDRYFTVAKAPDAWASLQQTVADLKSLRPVLTADGEIATWFETPAEGVEVHLWEKKLPDRTVIIAVNRDLAACDLSFAPRTLPKECRVQVLFEDREVEVKGGLLSDSFEALGVHVYEWAANG